MAETKRIAIVSGSNKGIGFEVVRQLASQGITVVLTARNEKRGLDALHKLKEYTDLSGDVIFHQLDVADPSSVASLTEFVKAQFGRLDILVNNAGIGGANLDGDALRASATAAERTGAAKINWDLVKIDQTYELALECLQTNYFGTKRMTEAFIPLLKSSKSPRILNVSSARGKLQKITNEWAKGILSDVDNLTEERVDEVVDEFLKDFKEGSLESKGWPSSYSAYIVSKVALNAYTRIVAKEQPNMKVNCICPGNVRTDINLHTGILSVEEGAEVIVKLALLPDDCPSGLFFIREEVSVF